MNSVYDSEATYCSEVEELMKLTTEHNNSSSNLPVRRSQRLLQKRLIDSSTSVKNVNKSQPKQKQIHKNESLKLGVLHKTTQDVFSTQELREAQDLAVTNLTCSQQKVIVPDKDVPLNLSLKNKKDLRKQQDSLFGNLNSEQQRAVTLNENKNNISITIPSIHKREQLLETQKKSVNLSMNSTMSQKDTSVEYLKENLQSSSLKTLNKNVKEHLSRASNDDEIPLQYVTVQDFQQKQPVQSLDNQPIFQPKLYNKAITKRRLPRTFNTEKQTKKKRIKSLAKNNKLNKNFMKVNAAGPTELEYEKNTTAKYTQNILTKSILPDVYPPHFKYQLPPEAVLSRPLIPYPTMITPENTPSYELVDSSSTSPSLPDSLRGIFDTDDIKEILNIKKVSYRLYDYHVQALAAILNLRVEYLLEILDKILQMNSNVLKTFDKAMKMPFVEDTNLFEPTPEGSPDDIVQNSQSPIDRKFFTQTKSNLRQKMC